ncbi:PBP1A family penicillin-binding protein [Deltaproteobacteria bacterium]|nr:PBP1A family penicillin-binding protein [Deltaproteobacteria bacterium]
MKKIIKLIIWGFMALCLFLVATGAVLWYFWSSNLPYIGSLKEYNPPIITEIFSDDGQVIGRFWNEKRIIVSLDQVPEHLINAFVAAEDARFFKHEGVDFQSIFRAFIKNLLAGKIEQGGSTITQQVTRSLLLKSQKRTYKRKAREAILSIQIEKSFSKDKILYLYINQIYLGHGAYGVEAAARTYFDKNAADLNLAESSLLAGLPQAPSRYSPILNYDKARARQIYVLERMAAEGFITEARKVEALETPIVIGAEGENTFEKSPYFSEHIRRYLEEEYGRDLLYGGGLKVYTTMNLAMQQSAGDAINKGLAELDKREGYRGPIRSLSPEEVEIFNQETIEKLRLDPPGPGSVLQGVVEEIDDENGQAIITIGGDSALLPLSEMKWARKPDPEVAYYEATVKSPDEVLKQGDVILCSIKEETDPPYRWLVSLEQEPRVQSALFALEVGTGKVKAMVGGRDFYVSQFNRAIQARRQPGSAFKPIIYSTALDRGMTPATVILDTPYISTMNPDEEVWRPRNYAETFYGPTLFRTSLIMSRNVITVKILQSVGVRNVIDYARSMGIESDLTPDLSLALGSSGLSLKEITTTYSIFANGGLLVEPFFIERIEDRSGLIIEENQPYFREAIPEDTAYVMTDLLKGVITEGTGWRAKALNRPVAGKTGTTNDLRDAWFIGYTPELVTGVWVGYDDRVPMGKGETGSRAASPIWLYFMSETLKGRPVEDFTAPESVVFAKIDAEKGLLASPYSGKTVFQSFKKGTEPTEYTAKPEAAKSGQFPQFDMDFTE